MPALLAALGLVEKATSYYSALEEVESVRLLSRGEMKYLFPDATIWTERFLGLPKSFVAYGHNPPRPPADGG